MIGTVEAIKAQFRAIVGLTVEDQFIDDIDEGTRCDNAEHSSFLVRYANTARRSPTLCVSPPQNVYRLATDL